MSDMAPPPVPPAPPVSASPPAPGRPGPVSDTSRLLAALGYPIWIVGLIAVLIDPYKNEKFVRFHAYQALALNLVGWIIVYLFTLVPILGWVLDIFLPVALLVYEIVLGVRAYGGGYFEVPGVFGFVKTYLDE